jgi:hypothetical protein
LLYLRLLLIGPLSFTLQSHIPARIVSETDGAAVGAANCPEGRPELNNGLVRSGRFLQAAMPERISYGGHPMKQLPARAFAPVLWRTWLIFLAGALAIVHSPATGADAPKKDRHEVLQKQGAGAANPRKPLRDPSALPEPVRRMRFEILRAAASGQIEALRLPIEMNELPPMFADKPTGDSIAFLRSASGDGEGREMLAVLINLLTTGCVRQSPSPGEEVYVWPYFAETPLDELTPAQEVELLRFVPAARFKEMRAKGKYDYYRLTIGGDGVWHTFMKDR